jgi:hypothetical protein
MTITLSQRGLSLRIGRSVSWIRKQGERVSTTVIRDGLEWKTQNETWLRERYASGRFSGYRLAAQSEDVA